MAAPRRVDGLQEDLTARGVGGAVLVVDDQVAVAGRGEELDDHRAVGHADRAVGLGPRQEAPAQGLAAAATAGGSHRG